MPPVTAGRPLFSALSQAEDSAQRAAQRAALLRRQIESEVIPENEAIGRLRGAIVNLETVRKALKKAREEQEEARKNLVKAEALVNGSLFPGQTPEQAARLPLNLEPRPRFPLWLGIVLILSLIHI